MTTTASSFLQEVGWRSAGQSCGYGLRNWIDQFIFAPPSELEHHYRMQLHSKDGARKCVRPAVLSC